MVQTPPSASILSRPVSVDAIPDDGLRIAVASSLEERAELARLNGLVELRSLQGTFLLRRQARGGVWVTGTVAAEVVQTCVVTLDKFDSSVSEPVDVHYLPDEALEDYRAARAKRVPDLSDEDADIDEPDPIVNDEIDVGHLTAEHLTLGLDPYPKKPGAQFEDVAPPLDDGKVSPFAVLKTLRTDDT